MIQEHELQLTPTFQCRNKTLPIIKVLDDLYHITFFSFGRRHKVLGKITISNSLNFALRYWQEYANVDTTFWPERLQGLDLLVYYGKESALTKKEHIMMEERLDQYQLSDKGIIIVKRHQGYIDTFNFSSIKYQNDRINPLLRNIKQLDLYCDFFVKEVADILTDPGNYKKDSFYSESNCRHERINEAVIRNTQYENPATKKFIKQHLLPICDITLTPAEAECLRWVIYGKNAYETGLILGKSHRTIENHLHSVRIKLGCNKISGTIKRAEKIGLIYGGQVYTSSVYIS